MTMKCVVEKPYMINECTKKISCMTSFIIVHYAIRWRKLYICGSIVLYANSCNLRSNNMLLIAPCHPRAKLKTYGERSFQHAALREVNNLSLLFEISLL